MDFPFFQSVAFFFKETLSFFSGKFDAILAFFLFLMGYKLFKIAIDKMSLNGHEINYRTFFILCIPAVFVSLFGAIFVINLAQFNLLIMFLFGSLITGISFAIMGYLLFLRGVFQQTDIEATWKDKSLLLKKASPGTIFCLFGVCVIVFSLWKGTEMVDSHQKMQTSNTKEIVTAIDRNIPVIVKAVEQYLGTNQNMIDQQENIQNKSTNELDANKANPK
jgi:hypothetical protein